MWYNTGRGSVPNGAFFIWRKNMTRQVRHGQPLTYNASGVTLSDGQSGSFQGDSSGNLKIVSGTGASSTQVQGAAADSAAIVGNPVPVGLKYEATQTARQDGDVVTVAGDAYGNIKTYESYKYAGEDLTNDVTKTEQRFTAVQVTADTQIKATAGFLHTLTFSCNDAAPTAGSIIVYNNTAESGTILYSETFDTTAFRGYSVLIDGSFTTGLYVGFTTTADVAVTVSYR